MDFKLQKTDSENIVFNAASDGILHQLKECLEGQSREGVFSLVSARNDGATPLVMACRNGHLDVALYLVESCHADIEQVGSVTFDEKKIQDAPPLWCAAAGGHLNIVKMLVNYNASVNCVTKRNSTALHVACAEGHLEIAKYLILHGADIEIMDMDENTCLMIACCKEHCDISKYLLECGADINRKDSGGNTALQLCAEAGRLDSIKMLLQCGAKHYCDSYGTTPLFTAALNGHSLVVEYFINEFNCTKLEKINALELLGSFFIILDYCDMVKAFECWKRAMELRHEDGESPLEKPTTRSRIASCIDGTEIRTLYQLEELVSGPDEMTANNQALLVVERILGPKHPQTFPYIIINGERYRKNGNAYRCMKLWMCALDIQLKVQDALRDRAFQLLSCFVELFSFMMVEGRPLYRDTPPVSFQDILDVFKINVRKIERYLHVLTFQNDGRYAVNLECILITAIHLIGLMCKLQPYLNVNENTELKKTTYDFVHLNPKGIDGSTPLHLACCEASLNYRFSVITFPSYEVVDLLLEVGACPNAVDVDNNTPLHIAAMNMPCPPAVFKALVNYGAHLDLCNNEGETPLELAEIIPFLDGYPMRYINLQCLSAKAIRKHEIAYEGFVHEKLKEFLDSH